MKYLHLFAFIAVMMMSCGPSKEEGAQLQKAREDSIRLATEKATALRLTSISVLKDSIAFRKTSIEGMASLLIVQKADLVASTDKLNIIRQPQFLRTSEERERQIRHQVIVIQNLEKKVQELAHRIESEKQQIANLRKRLSSLQ
jgi:hypothetical protein